MGKNIKSRVLLDEKMLEVANKFYSSTLAENALNRECFSHPDMDSHICNPLARLDGGEECTYCDHMFRKRCYITCHIHRFCLAVYAFRLGIGDDDLWKAIKVNTTGTPYSKLHESVMEAIRVEPDEKVPECGEAQDIRAVKIADPESVTIATTTPSPGAQGLPVVNTDTVEEEAVEDFVEEPPVPIDDTEYLTIQETADLFGCTPPNIHSYAARGRIEKLKVNGVVVVRKADALELRDNKGKRKKKDVVETKKDFSDAIIGLPTFEETEEEYITRKEAADLFGCSYPNICSHITRGNLEKLKVDGKVVVRKSDVLKLKATKRRGKKEINNAE